MCQTAGNLKLRWLTAIGLREFMNDLEDRLKCNRRKGAGVSEAHYRGERGDITSEAGEETCY
jgi:hypothetical protein